MKMKFKIFVQVVCMRLVVVGLNLKGSQGNQTTKRSMPSTLLQTVFMARRTTTQRAKPTTLLQTVLRATTQRAMTPTLLQTVLMTRRTTTQRAMTPTLLQTVLMTKRTTTIRTLQQSTPTISDNMTRHGLHNYTSHGTVVAVVSNRTSQSVSNRTSQSVSNRTSQSAGTHVAELSTITTQSLQEAAMKLFIWNLTDNATGHDMYDHDYYEDYLHILYDHCAREYGWTHCLEFIPEEVEIFLCNDIRSNKTYNGSIQKYPYIFEYFDYYNLDIHTLSCGNQINDGFRLAYDIVTKVLGSLGLLGNWLSIITIYTADKELTSTSIYLIALAISDSVYVLGKITILEELKCKMSEIGHEVLLCISAWFLVVITVERFKSIYNPYTVQNHCYPRSAMIYVAIIPIICSAIGITMYLAGVYEQLCYPKTDEEAYDAGKKVNVTWFVLVFLIPFLLIFTLNMAIVRSLYKAAKQRHDMSKSDSDKEKRITRTLAIVTIAYLILVGPHYTFNFIREFASQHYDEKVHERMEYTIKMLDLLQMLNYCVNFLIYTLCGSKYRDSFLTLLKRIRCKHNTHIV